MTAHSGAWPCDMQFFARGVFAWPTITGYRGQRPGLLGALRTHAWAARALALSGLDWPLRRLGNGSFWRWLLLHAGPSGPPAQLPDAGKVMLYFLCRKVDGAAPCGASRAGQRQC